LKDCQATKEEIVYLLTIMRMGQELSRGVPGQMRELSPYFKRLFQNEKVIGIWKTILYEKFIFRTKFVELANNYIAEIESKNEP